MLVLHQLYHLLRALCRSTTTHLSSFPKLNVAKSTHTDQLLLTSSDLFQIKQNQTARSSAFQLPTAPRHRSVTEPCLYFGLIQLQTNCSSPGSEFQNLPASSTYTTPPKHSNAHTEQDVTSSRSTKRLHHPFATTAPSPAIQEPFFLIIFPSTGKLPLFPTSQ